MLKEVEVKLKSKVVIALEYYLFAFKTSKGTFTLSGSNVDGTDEFKRIEDKTFHTWTREQVHHWFIQGKITPVHESLTIDWHANTFGKRKSIKTH